MARLCLHALLAALMLPGAASAQTDGLFTPPEGCTAALTVQSRSCRVEHIYSCAADPQGHQWRVVMDAEGPIFVSRIDAETQWVESFDLFPSRRNVLRQPATDPASLTELLATGIDTYDFVQIQGTQPVRIVGYDRLTGNDAVIDGEPLLGTEFSARFEDANGTYLTVTGNEWVSDRHRRFFGGRSTRTLPGGRTAEQDYSPVEFFYPGEKGFLAARPEYDCNRTIAQAPPRVHPAADRSAP